MLARILIVAGSDSGGGAGIQADIKTVTILGGYASTAITALTAQNTLGVFDIYPVPPSFIQQQMRLVLEDIGADIIKIGMLHDQAVIESVAEVLKEYPHIPYILDPVMVAKGGANLLEDTAITALKSHLLTSCYLVTPNIPEAMALTNRSITTFAEMEQAAKAIQQQGAKNVLMKGGHMIGEELRDILLCDQQIYHFTSKRLMTTHTHGTGCSLASAIACFVAQGMQLPEAVAKAREYLYHAIEKAPQLGQGHGPLHHGWILDKSKSN